jgi:hypothetical protein
MPKDRREARFAVGARQSPRSTIWKAWTQGDEAYLASRVYGDELKVSFHSSGQCQWSATNSWVVRTGAQRNADRHIVQWQIDPPIGDEAVMVFRVDIPVSEIQPSGPLKDKKKIFWISGAANESTIRVLFYLTRVCDEDPAFGRALPHKHLFSLRFRNSRWLVALVDQITLSQSDLRAAREAVRDQVLKEGLSLDADHRIHLFLEPREGASAGLIELCGHDLDSVD